MDEQIGAEIIGQSLGAEEIAEQNGVEAEIDGDEEAESGDAAGHRRVIGAERMRRDEKSANDAGSREQVKPGHSLVIADDSDGDSTDAVGHSGDGDEEGGFRSPDAQSDGAIDDKVEGNVVAETDEEHGRAEEDEDGVGEKTQVHDP